LLETEGQKENRAASDGPRSPVLAEEEELFGSLPSRSTMNTWYPTLRKLHWILALLHDFVKVGS